MDAIAAQLPLDPFISMGLITFAAGGAGWLVGPIIGAGVFNWRNRKVRPQMDAKEKEFYVRVKKFRVDPSVSSIANPVPGMLHCLPTYLRGGMSFLSVPANLGVGRLLRRKDLQRRRLSTLVEGSESIQQEAPDICLSTMPK